MTINYESSGKEQLHKKDLSLQNDKLKLKEGISDKLCLSLISFMLTMFSKQTIC